MWFELNPAVDKNPKLFLGTYDNMSIVFVVTAFLVALLLMMVGRGLEWFIEVCGPVIVAMILGIQGAAAVANGLWVTAIIMAGIAAGSCMFLVSVEQTGDHPAERWLFTMTMFGLAWVTIHDSAGTFDA
ncbi:MAG TPA: hypothetical protein VHB93_00750, partial [Candidatus Paceibacterota bacterium]|nr:hypothetical protein [Candidatus Paceibacterota bacterium]